MHGWSKYRREGAPPMLVQGPVMLDKLDKALGSRRKPSRSVNDKSRPKSRRPCPADLPSKACATARHIYRELKTSWVDVRLLFALLPSDDCTPTSDLTHLLCSR